MLVLTRRRDEKVILPSLHVTVQVLEVKRGVVRLGIEAPGDVGVVREELLALPRPGPRGASPGTDRTAADGGAIFNP